jgi:Na+/proline symporter
MDLIGTVVIAVVCAALIMIGLWGYKVSKKTMSDYATFGGKGSYIVMGVYSLTTVASVFSVMGVVGSSYTLGMPYLLNTASPVLSLTVGIMLLAPRMMAARELYGHYSPGQLIGGAYNSKLLASFVAVFMFVYFSVYCTMQFSAIGAILAPFFGTTPAIAGFIMAIVMLLYIVLGGMRAVAWTCVVYFILMVIGYFTPFVLLVFNVPFATVLPNVNPDLLNAGGTIHYLLPLLMTTLVINWFFGVFSYTGLLMGASAKGIKVVKFMSVFTWILMALFMCCSFIIGGIYGSVLIPGLPPIAAATVFSNLINQYVGVSGLTLAYALCVLGAALSTIATMVGLAGMTIEADVVTAWGIKFGEKGRMNLSKLLSCASVGFGFFIWVVLALPVGSYFSLMIQPISILLVPLGVGMLWKRGTKWGAWASLAVGIGVVILGSFVQIPLFLPWPPTLLTGIAPLLAFPCALIAYIVVSLLTKPTPKEISEKYHDNLTKWIKENS